MHASKKVSKQEIQKVLAWLYEYFPAAFFKKGREVKPLQIGIYEDLLDFYERFENPPFCRSLLKEALHYYSASQSYLKAHKPDAPRVDLYGQEVDIVTPAQAQYAEEKFLTRYEKHRTTEQENIAQPKE